MADPMSGLAAVGVVANIFQLLEFTAKLAKQTREILRSTTGRTGETQRLEQLVAEYDRLSTAICKDGEKMRPRTQADTELDNIARLCKEQAADLLGQFSNLRLDNTQRGVKRTWKGIEKAAKSAFVKRELETKHQRLAELNSQLAARVLIMLKAELSDVSSVLQELDLKGQHTLDDVLDLKKVILDAIAAEQESRDVKKRVDKILKSLWVPEMNQRHKVIPEAYAQTYEWAFETSSSFYQWLDDGTDLFWIRGKAGSGKSTFMKFIAAHVKCQKALEKWLGEDDLVIADFYFWYLGTEMQKSIRGLLQSIVHRIISKRPDLTSTLCPQRWREARAKQPQKPWTEAELYEVVEHAAQATASNTSACAPGDDAAKSRSRCNFFVLIDGLDEYEGDHIQLASKLKKWSQNSRIKLCVSSRPWNVFRASFSRVTNVIHLEDLTRPDIHHYVFHKLSEARSLLLESDVLPERDPFLCELARVVVDKAQGVFLWVFLVVKSLIRGLAEGDTLKTLLRRVAMFPSDLYDYFKLILERVDGVYAKQTAHTLLMAKTIIDLGAQGLDASFLPYGRLLRADGDLDLCVGGEMIYCNMKDLRNMRNETQRFLSACCKDLLEVSRSDTPGSDKLMNNCYESLKDLEASLAEQKVEFLHRTVYEFLCTKDVYSLLTKSAPTIIQHPNFREALTLIRLQIIFRDPGMSIECFCSYFYNNAHRICKDLSASAHSLAIELDRIGQYWSTLDRDTSCLCEFSSGRSRTLQAILPELASYGANRTLNAAMSTATWRPYRSLYFHILQAVLGLETIGAYRAVVVPKFGLNQIDHDLVENLLTHRADPNEAWKNCRSLPPGSLWQQFLQKWLLLRVPKSKKSSGSSPAEAVLVDQGASNAHIGKIARLLVRFGADLSAPVVHPVKGSIIADIALAELDA